MATKSWIGQAVAVADVWTLTPGGTIASGSVFTLTINGKDLVYTATGSALADTTAGIVAAWNDTVNPPPPEFRELEATDTGTTVVLTGLSKGRPHTISVAASGSGSPTASISNTTAATGPNHFNNADNWSDGAAPANSDVLVFDRGATPVLYGLSSTLTGNTIYWRPGYRGAIGLPPINRDGDAYGEYRTRYLTLDGATLVQLDSSDIGRFYLNTGTTAATIVVNQTGSREDDNIPAVCLRGGHSSNVVTVNRGDVGLAYFAGETSTVPDLRVSFVANRATDARVICGTGATLTTVTKTGGDLTIRSNVTTLTQGPQGGTTTIEAGAITTLNLNGGTCVYNSTGTLGTATVANDGFLDFDQDARGKTVTNPVEVYGATARLRDTRKVVSSLVVDLNRTGDLARLELGDDLRITRGSVA